MKIIFLLLAFFIPATLLGEDGSRLWLRYEPLPENISRNYAAKIQWINAVHSETGKIIDREFREAFEILTGKQLYFPKMHKEANSLHFQIDKKLKERYRIQTQTLKNGSCLVVSSADDVGLLYGMYHLLRYTAYARANASIGINGTVLNNVNANPEFITRKYLLKAAALADIFRPYGIRVYLSVNFSSPAELGGLPGPQDFGRTHADGANMLAEALEPYNGIVMWRAFVYNPQSLDRSKQAYEEFAPLDGQFHKNVIIQVKNGPIDFQPREPFSPLFGAMQKTPLMIEFQITQEYLGFSQQLAYLAPLYEECLQSDTYARGEGSAVAKITGGTVFPLLKIL